jgi:hypothetical protein
VFRQLDALLEFVGRQIRPALIELATSNDLRALNPRKSFVIGHFDGNSSTNYVSFSKVAELLRDECEFAASTNQ